MEYATLIMNLIMTSVDIEDVEFNYRMGCILVLFPFL